MTSQIAEALETHLKPQGVAVLVQAHHACMGLRGVRKPNAIMTTSAMHGAFRDQQATREEFLAFARNGR
jgi:GTP cyclohydrolase I